MMTYRKYFTKKREFVNVYNFIIEESISQVLVYVDIKKRKTNNLYGVFQIKFISLLPVN